MHIFADDGQTTNNFSLAMARGDGRKQRRASSIMAVSIGLSRSMLMLLHMLL